MSNAISSHPERMPAPSGPITGILVSISVAVWLIVVSALASNHVFVAPSGSPPLALLIGVLGPIAVFLAAFYFSRPFASFVLSADPKTLLGMQAWRFAGVAFLDLQVHGILPGYFAWPAGFGDMAIGLTAPWLIGTLIRRPEFATSRAFVVWNLLGLLDLVTAIGVGAIGSFLLANAGGAAGASTGPMAVMPLVLVPTFLVPIFAILHLIALFQVRRARDAAKTAPA